MTSPDPQKRVLPWDRPRYTNAHFAEEERECWRLRKRGLSLREISAETGLSKSTVERRLRCTFQEFREDTATMRDQWVQMELDRLDAAQQAVVAVLEAQHLVVSEGRVVRIDGQPLPDHGPVLAAVREFRMLSESRRRLLGLDAPTKHEHRGTGDVDAAVAALVALMDEKAGADERAPESA